MVILKFVSFVSQARLGDGHKTGFGFFQKLLGRHNNLNEIW